MSGERLQSLRVNVDLDLLSLNSIQTALTRSEYQLMGILVAFFCVPACRLLWRELVNNLYNVGDTETSLFIY